MVVKLPPYTNMCLELLYRAFVYSSGSCRIWWPPRKGWRSWTESKKPNYFKCELCVVFSYFRWLTDVTFVGRPRRSWPRGFGWTTGTSWPSRSSWCTRWCWQERRGCKWTQVRVLCVSLSVSWMEEGNKRFVHAVDLSPADDLNGHEVVWIMCVGRLRTCRGLCSMKAG